METAVFGGGCFWCTEAVFNSVRGVQKVESGYCGGHIENPSYEQVCEGSTGHIEVVSIQYDETVVSYDTLLDVFFATHDPSTPGRQGHDVGPQYQSVIFYCNPEQRNLAQRKIEEIDRSGVYPAAVSTEVRPVESFWPAEQYHDNYYERNPNQGYCQFVIQPKVLKFRRNYSKFLKE